MIPQATNISQELDEKTSKPLEFQQVLFLQANRILQSWSERRSDFIEGIEALDAAMAYFKEKDKKFAEELKAIDKRADEEMRKARRYGGSIPPEDMNQITYIRSKLRLEALMKLMGRAGFFPESQAEWVEPK